MTTILVALMCAMAFCGCMAAIQAARGNGDSGMGWIIVAAAVFVASIGFILGATFGPMLS